MAKQPQYRAEDFERIPKDKARRYRLKTDHSVTLSRRTYDTTYGRLAKEGFASYEEKARTRREAGIPKPKGGRAPRQSRRPVTPPTPPQQPRIPQDIEDKLETATHSHGWFSQEFDALEAAERFIRYLPRTARVWIVAYGMLHPGTSGGAAEDQEPVWGWRTVLASTLQHSVDIQEAAREANNLFVVVETWVVRWRSAQRIT